MPAGLRDTLREFINPQLRGIEMGPSYNPIAPKRLQYDVTTVDHAPADVLRQKYANANVDINRIEDVDIIWTGGDLLSVFPDNARETYHYIAAAHFIEHMVDMVSFIRSCEALLMTDGLILLLVPDQRYCFDFFQPTSDAAELIERHLRRSAGHGFAAYYRHLTQSVLADENRHDWDQGPIHRYATTLDDPRNAIEVAQQFAASADYVDTHGQYFTPCAFQSVIEELRYLGLITVSVHYMSKAVGCEFLAVLRKHEAPQLDLEQFRRRKLALQLGMLNEKAEQIYRLQASDTWQDGLRDLMSLHYEGDLFTTVLSTPATLAAPIERDEAPAARDIVPVETDWVDRVFELSKPYVSDGTLLPPVCTAAELRASVMEKHWYDNPTSLDAALAALEKDTLPVPAPGNREGYGHDDDAAYWLLGFDDFIKVRRVAERLGVATDRVLDFGGSTGRVYRHFYTQCWSRQVYSCDFKQVTINWCKLNFPPEITVFLNTFLPSLPFPDEFFDVITAFSVFTHIDEFEDAWLLELSRVLRPGGLAYVTIHDENTWATRAIVDRISPAPQAAGIDFDAPMQFDRRGFNFRRGSHYSCNVFHSSDYVRRYWSRYFQIESIEPFGHHSQAVVIARK